jgi:hypothetical protein
MLKPERKLQVHFLVFFAAGFFAAFFFVFSETFNIPH